MSNGHSNNDDVKQTLPGETNITLLHGPLTKEEQRTRDEREHADADKKSEDSYKKRQLDLTESNVKLAYKSFILTCVLALFTLLGALAAWYQGHVAVRSAKASEKSAYAACMGAEVARSALIETQRMESDTRQASVAATSQAAVAIQTAIPVIVPVLGDMTVHVKDKIGVEISYKNTGNTPALDIQGATRMVFIRREEDPDFFYPTKVIGTMVGSRIPANSSFPATKIYDVVKNSDGTPYIPVQKDKDDFDAESKDMIFFGYVKYGDVFGGRHTMQFCAWGKASEVNKMITYSHLKCASYNKIDTVKKSFSDPTKASAPEIEPIPCKKPED